ncbi:hypothetical protein ACIPN8_03765 [Streptomyces sp. NPDC086082]
MTTARSDFDRALERIGKGSHVSLTTFGATARASPPPSAASCTTARSTP